MKSSRPVVRVMEVLEHHHHRARSRRAARRTSARPRTAASGRRSRPRRPAGRGAPARSSAAPPGRGRARGRSRRSVARVVASSSASTRPAAPADHLAQGPEGDPVAVGRAAALRATRRVSTRPSRYLRNSHARRLLPMPAGPDDADQPWPLLPARGLEQVLELAQLLVAADERRLQACRSGCARRARRRRAGRATRGRVPSLPLSSCSPASSNTMAPDAARSVASPTSTVPGGAADWSRDGGVDDVARDHALVRRRRW